jgi:hypothetical protein
VERAIEDGKNEKFLRCVGCGVGFGEQRSRGGSFLSEDQDCRLKEREVTVDLVFNKDTRMLLVRDSKAVVAEIPYDAIDKVSYEFSKHRRVKQGALIMVASLGDTKEQLAESVWSPDAYTVQWGEVNDKRIWDLQEKIGRARCLCSNRPPMPFWCN